MKVLKFGGTSVADSKSINSVISILKDNDEPLFIIVSALGGMQNIEDVSKDIQKVLT